MLECPEVTLWNIPGPRGGPRPEGQSLCDQPSSAFVLISGAKCACVCISVWGAAAELWRWKNKYGQDACVREGRRICSSQSRTLCVVTNSSSIQQRPEECLQNEIVSQSIFENYVS